MTVIPTLPDSNTIRVYPNVNCLTDSESETEMEPTSVPDDPRQSTADRLVQNQDYMDEQIKQSNWILGPQSLKTAHGKNVVLIRKPTASNMSFQLLNPYIYRNIQNIGTLDQLAAMLNAPSNWNERYHQVIANGVVLGLMQHLCSLPRETFESRIQAQFTGIVSTIASYLELLLLAKSETRIIVGGILARHEYDLRSRTDPNFITMHGDHVIASEIKTLKSFPSDGLWYHDARGIQVLSTLYAFNCPVFLMNQKHWKLFIENDARNAIYTYPYNVGEDTAHVRSTLMDNMGRDFLKAIVICLLSNRSKAALPSKDPATLQTPSQRPVVKSTHFTPSGPRRTSSRLKKARLFKEETQEEEDGDLGQGESERNEGVQGESERNEGVQGELERKEQVQVKLLGKEQEEKPKRLPTFISGYDQDQPIYSIVRVVPQDRVAQIEDEIATQENPLPRQDSESTLY